MKQPIVIFTLSLVTSVALAHGGHDHGGDHFMGTVKAADEKTLTIETKDKKEMKFTLDAATKVERDGKGATAKEIAVGDRVVVMAEKKEGSTDLVASGVKISSGAAKVAQ